MTTSRISALTDQPTVVGTDRIAVDANPGTTRSMLVSLLENLKINATGVRPPSVYDKAIGLIPYGPGSLWTIGNETWLCLDTGGWGPASWGSRGIDCQDNVSSPAVPPDVTDDSSAGYSVYSLWTMNTGNVYYCSDATVGAAVWNDLGVISVINNPTGSSFPIATNDSSEGYSVGSIWAHPLFDLYVCSDASVGAAVWNGTESYSASYLRSTFISETAPTIQGQTLSFNSMSGAWGPADAVVVPLVNTTGTTYPTVDDDASQGYVYGSIWNYTISGESFYCANPSTGEASWVSRGYSALDNRTATADPTASDDDTQGYSVGSIWVWGTPGFAQYICTDATTGAAVWDTITYGALDNLIGTGEPGVNDDDIHGYSLGSTWCFVGHASYYCSDATTGAAVWNKDIPTLVSVTATTPEPVGTAATGIATDASRADHVHGQSTRDRTVATDDTLSNATDDVIRVSAQADLQLPDPAGKRLFVIKKTGSTAYTCNVLRYGTETIEGVAADLELPGSANLDFPAWGIYSDGTNWWVC